MNCSESDASFLITPTVYSVAEAHCADRIVDDPRKLSDLPESDHRRTAVFDADETLVYARLTTSKKETRLFIRPGACEMLAGVAACGHEVILWTAGAKMHGAAVVYILEREAGGRLFDHIISRGGDWHPENVRIPSGGFPKILSLLSGRDAIIVDDNTNVVAHGNPFGCAIVVPKFRPGRVDLVRNACAALSPEDDEWMFPFGNPDDAANWEPICADILADDGIMRSVESAVKTALASVCATLGARASPHVGVRYASCGRYLQALPYVKPSSPVKPSESRQCDYLEAAMRASVSSTVTA